MWRLMLTGFISRRYRCENACMPVIRQIGEKFAKGLLWASLSWVLHGVKSAKVHRPSSCGRVGAGGVGDVCEVSCSGGGIYEVKAAVAQASVLSARRGGTRGDVFSGADLLL
jgi:hypothetical protein